MIDQPPPVDTISVTVKHACKITGLSHTTIYKLIGLGKLRSVKIGRRTLITYASLQGLFTTGNVKGGGESGDQKINGVLTH